MKFELNGTSAGWLMVIALLSVVAFNTYGMNQSQSEGQVVTPTSFESTSPTIESSPQEYTLANRIVSEPGESYFNNLPDIKSESSVPAEYKGGGCGPDCTCTGACKNVVTLQQSPPQIFRTAPALRTPSFARNGKGYATGGGICNCNCVNCPCGQMNRSMQSNFGYRNSGSYSTSPVTTYMSDGSIVTEQTTYSDWPMSYVCSVFNFGVRVRPCYRSWIRCSQNLSTLGQIQVKLSVDSQITGSRVLRETCHDLISTAFETARKGRPINEKTISPTSSQQNRLIFTILLKSLCV